MNRKVISLYNTGRSSAASVQIADGQGDEYYIWLLASVNAERDRVMEQLKLIPNDPDFKVHRSELYDLLVKYSQLVQVIYSDHCIECGPHANKVYEAKQVKLDNLKHRYEAIRDQLQKQIRTYNQGKTVVVIPLVAKKELITARKELDSVAQEIESVKESLSAIAVSEYADTKIRSEAVNRLAEIKEDERLILDVKQMISAAMVQQNTQESEPGNTLSMQGDKAERKFNVAASLVLQDYIARMDTLFTRMIATEYKRKLDDDRVMLRRLDIIRNREADDYALDLVS